MRVFFSLKLYKLQNSANHNDIKWGQMRRFGVAYSGNGVGRSKEVSLHEDLFLQPIINAYKRPSDAATQHPFWTVRLRHLNCG